MLGDHNTASVKQLAELYYVSESTIRRDLTKISSESGAIRRTYGGAFMLDNLSNELPINIRERENIEAKNKIAEKASLMISDGATLILDTSSTVTEIVPYLNRYDGLTVITNSIKTTYLLNSYSKITTFCTGGRLRDHNMSLIGSAACSRLEEINADIAFISCRGFTPEKGVTEASDEEAQVKKAMIKAAVKTVLLCDSTKIGLVLMNRICPAEFLYAVITDKELPEHDRSALDKLGVKVIVS